MRVHAVLYVDRSYASSTNPRLDEGIKISIISVWIT
jgi:hypothetical protein